MAHITGGGITENLPRVLPEGCAAEIDLRSWSVPPLFDVLQQRGGIATDEMFRAFNMGVGLVIVCAARDAQRVVDMLSQARRAETRSGSGSCVAGERVVRCGTSSVTREPPARRPDLRARQQPPVDHRRRCATGGSTATIAVVHLEPAGRGRAAARARCRASRRSTSNPRDYPDRDAYDAALADGARGAARRSRLPRRLHAPGRRSRCSTHFPIGS